MGLNTGGMDYEINISGDFEAKLAKFQKGLDSLSRKQASSQQGGSSSGGGKGGDAIQRRVLALEKQILLANAKVLDLKEAIAKNAKILAQSRREGVRLADKEAQKEVVRSKAFIKTTKQLENQAVLLRRLNVLKAKGVTTEKAQAQALGISVKKLREIDSLHKRNAVNAQRAVDRAKVATKAETEKARLAKASRDGLASQRRYEDVALQGKLRNLAADREMAITRSRVTDLSEKDDITLRAAAEKLGVSATQAKKLGLNMWDATHAAKQFLFTFRRLVGILAIFTLARKLAQALGQGVAEMSRFNAEIETAEIGVASIVASVGQIRDVNGELVTGADAYGVAMQASQKVMAQLKKDAIGSIATFEALVKSYQVAVGPGLAAGLDLDQIRVLSKRLAEGAITLGVPLNQLSEEIRSLLQGTATARNTRIAVLFGGAKEANEAIRNAKEQGNLYEVLTAKLAGVKMGADAASMSMSVLKSDLQDAMQLLLAEGGIQYFDQLKDSLFALRGALTSQGEDGATVFKPEALAIAQEVGDTLASIIDSFRTLTNTSSVLDTLSNILGVIGDTLKVIAPVVAVVFQGIMDGVNAVVAPLRVLMKVFAKVGEIKALKVLGAGFGSLVSGIIAGIVAIRLWNKLLKMTLALSAIKSYTKGVERLASLFKIVGILQGELNTRLFVANILAGKFAAAQALIKWRMAGMLGIWGVVATVIITILARMKVFRKLTDFVTKGLSKTSDAAEDVEESITGAVEATAEGAKSAEDWRKEFEKLDRALVTAFGMNQLKDSAQDVGELFTAMVASLSEGTKASEKQLKASKARLATLKDELKVVKDKLKAEEAANGHTPYVESDMGMLSGAFGFSASFKATGEAARKNKLLKEERGILVAIKQAKDDIAETSRKELKALEKRMKILEAGRSSDVRKLSDLEDVSATNLKIYTTMSDRLNVSVKELTILKARKAMLTAERYLSQQMRTEAIQSLEANIKKNKELQATTGNYYAEEASRLRDRISEVKGKIVSSAVEDTEKWIAKLKVVEAQYKEIQKAGADVLNSTQAITRQEEELARLKEQNVSAIQEALALEQKNTIEIEKQMALMGDAGAIKQASAAWTQGLQAFYDELPNLGVRISDEITSALGDISGVVGDLFKDAIDPRTDADIRTAFGEFFLDLAGTFASHITDSLIASGIAKLGMVKPVDPAEEARKIALEANTSATRELTLALKAKAGTGTSTPSPQVDASGGGSGADQASTNAGGFLGGLAAASPWLAMLFIPIVMALIAKAFNKGGQVKGYASGGAIAEGLPKPSHIPASDTVPAWLTPGEFVVKKDAVKKYGVGMLTALNNGILNPASFSATGLALGGMARSVQGFATGGNVKGYAPGQQSSSGRGNTGQNPATVILPVLPTTENNMEQMISGGREAFGSNVNKIDFIGDPNRSGAWA